MASAGYAPQFQIRADAIRGFEWKRLPPPRRTAAVATVSASVCHWLQQIRNRLFPSRNVVVARRHDRFFLFERFVAVHDIESLVPLIDFGRIAIDRRFRRRGPITRSATTATATTAALATVFGISRSSRFACRSARRLKFVHNVFRRIVVVTRLGGQIIVCLPWGRGRFPVTRYRSTAATTTAATRAFRIRCRVTHGGTLRIRPGVIDLVKQFFITIIVERRLLHRTRRFTPWRPRGFRRRGIVPTRSG